MSNEIVKGEVVFTCDAADCGEFLETGEGGFAEANQVRKDEGWIAFKNDLEDWEHRCPTCKGRSATIPPARRHWADRD